MRRLRLLISLQQLSYVHVHVDCVVSNKIPTLGCECRLIRIPLLESHSRLTQTIMKKRILPWLCMLSLAACGGSDNHESADTSKNQLSQQTPVSNSNKPVYRVVTELVNIPLVLHDTHTQKISGFELELLQAIAEKQGFALDFSNVHPWQGIFQTLEDDTGDIVAGAVTYSNDRSDRMDLTNPHLEYDFALLVQPEFADARGFGALRGKKVALKGRSISETLIPMFGVSDESNIIRTKTTWEAIKDILTGEAEAAVGSSLVMEHYASEYPDKKLAVIYDASLPKNHYVFAVKKGNTELQQKLNTGLEKIKADGTYDKIYRQYWKIKHK